MFICKLTRSPNAAAEFSPAYLANGVVGLRVGRIPQLGGAAVVNGFSGVHNIEHIEGSAPAPYPLSGDLLLNGVWLSQRANPPRGAAFPS